MNIMIGFKSKYYSLDQIDKVDSQYKIIIGERSNGKTYAVLKKMLDGYLDHGAKSAYVRRWDTDIKTYRVNRLYSGMAENGYILKASKGKFNDVIYRRGAFYLVLRNEDGEIVSREENPFCACFAISNAEHDKGGTFSTNIETVLFDEFVTRRAYLPDEFISWNNTLSTIVRTNDKATIYMVANNVSWTCPYFVEMGLNRVRSMKQGEIDVYQYGETGLKVAVEYVKPMEQSAKPSNIYFAFDNPRLNMIKNGAWEIAVYPHLPEKYRLDEIVLTFFIMYEGDILHCDVVRKPSLQFIFVHNKTTDIQNPDHDIIYSPEFDARPNWFRDIYAIKYPFQKKLASLIRMNKLYFQSNEVGEVFRNYIKWCRGHEDFV